MPINLQVFTKCQSSALLLRDWKTNSVTVCPHGLGDVTGRCGVFLGLVSALLYMVAVVLCVHIPGLFSFYYCSICKAIQHLKRKIKNWLCNSYSNR